MNKLGRCLFYLLVLFLWVSIGLGALEIWARWHWTRIETNNPFVRSRTQHELWPIPRIPENDFSAWLMDETQRAPYRGRGKSLDPLAIPSPEEEVLWRFPAFLAQDTFGRQVFSNVYGLNFYSITSDGRLRFSFSEPESREGETLAEHLNPADTTLVLEAAQQIAREKAPYLFLSPSEPAHPGPFGYALLPDTEMPGEEIFWLLGPRKTAWLPPEVDTIWELPFFTYQKHVERKDRISALGITEDFYMNNYGFRDSDIVMPKPEGTYRIVCVGASTTEEGPINALTYPAILETLLNRHFGFDRIDVVNCGISGMNSLKHRMRIADYLALEPDLIVLYNAVNDICHDLFPIWVNAATPLQTHLRKSRFFCRYFGRRLLPDIETMRSDIQNVKMSNLAFITEYAREKEVKVAVCSFAAPDPAALSRVERDYYEYYTVLEWAGRYSNFDSYLYALGLYNEALRLLCREKDLLYIPVEENMRDGVIIYGDICHLRNPGIEKKAAIIAETLIPVVEQAITGSRGL